MSSPAPAVLVMARAAVPGRVKTRLEPLLGPRGCARLQEVLITHAVATAQDACPGRVYLALTPGAAELRGGAVLLEQHGADLGQRMTRAVADVLEREAGPVLVIGADAPTLGRGLLSEAAAMLAEGCGVVFGPALDGGYYLVALPRSLPQVFAIDPVLWGGPQVLAVSVQRATLTGLRVGMLSLLRDLDTPEDAAALLDAGGLPEDIAALLAVAPERR